MKLVLPDFYEDELFFSWLARVEVRNMFFSYSDTARCMFGNPKTRVSFEFINALTPEFVGQVERKKSIENIIQSHTMFPYYSCFWNTERKAKAYEALAFMQSQRENALTLPLPKDGQKKMYYCPVCAKNERSKFGECYWHRAHQIDGVFVCHKHECRLVSSDVVITTRKKYELIPAEFHIPDTLPEPKRGTDKEILLAQYLYDLLSCSTSATTGNLADFLHFRMNGTKYLNRRGSFIKAKVLYEDYLEYWGKDAAITNARAMKELCNGNRVNTYTIAQVAIMVGIPAEDLIKLEVTDLPVWEQFDKEVARLNETGIGYLDIAQAMDASPHLIEACLKRQGLKRNRIKKEYRPRKKAV